MSGLLHIRIPGHPFAMKDICFGDNISGLHVPESLSLGFCVVMLLIFHVSESTCGSDIVTYRDPILSSNDFELSLEV
jgi:hypothetical protein